MLDDINNENAIWAVFTASFVLYILNNIFQILPTGLTTILNYIVITSLVMGLAIESWRSLVEWKEKHGGIGSAIFNLIEETLSSIWDLIMLVLFLGVGIFIIVSFFSNPMMTIIWVFVGIVLLVFARS